MATVLSIFLLTTMRRGQNAGIALSAASWRLRGFALGLVVGAAVALPVHAGVLTGHVIDQDGLALPDAVVTVTPTGLHASSGKRPAPKVVRLDQKGREFIPHVLAVRVGTPVAFPNSDDIQHHVYSFSPAKRFEIKLYRGTPAEPVRFDRPGIAALGCNIHDWMLAYVFVTEAPYFTTTDAQGTWRLELPDGPVRLNVWHPDAAEPTQLPVQEPILPASEALEHRIRLKIRRMTGKPPTAVQSRVYPTDF